MKRAQVAVGLAAVCLLAAGCTGNDPAPSPSTSTTVSSTSSASASTAPSSTSAPTATGPAVAIPAAAKAHTRAGAEAMATFFLQEFDKALQTNDASRVRSISSPTCVACNSQADTVAKQIKEGVHQRGGALSVVGIPPVPEVDLAKPQQVNVLVNALAVPFVNQAGQVVRTSTAGKLTVRVLLSWHGNAWVVDAAGKVAL